MNNRNVKKLKPLGAYLRYAMYLAKTILKISFRLMRRTTSGLYRRCRGLKQKSYHLFVKYKNYCRAQLKNLKYKFYSGYVFSTAFNEVVTLLEKNGLPEVINFLSKKYRYSGYAAIRFLKKLYLYTALLEKNDLQLWSNKKNGEKVLIHFCCWGSSYAYKVTNYLLPSLLSDNNLPLLAKTHNICLLIHCDRLTKALIVDHESYKDLIKYINIQFYIFTGVLMKSYHTCVKRNAHVLSIFPTVRYLLLGVCQTHAFKIALQNDAYVSFLMPDVVISESFMTYAFEKMINKKVLLTTTYRTNHRSVVSDLSAYYLDADKKRKLTIPADKLVHLQIRHMHPNEEKRIVSTKTKNFSPMARLVFKEKNGYIFRCFHYHPVIINCKNIARTVKLDYLPIDNTALNFVMDKAVSYQDQTWVCDDASQMAIMELSDENPETDAIINTSTLTYQELMHQVRDLIVKAPTIYDSPFNRFLISHRHRFVVEGVQLNHDNDMIDDVVFFSQILESLNQTVSN